MDILAEFTIGFRTVTSVLLCIAGGVAAIAVCAAVTVLAVCVAGLVFDAVTNAMAKHWNKTGHRPRHRLGRIIADSLVRRCGTKDSPE